MGVVFDNTYGLFVKKYTVAFVVLVLLCVVLVPFEAVYVPKKVNQLVQNKITEAYKPLLLALLVAMGVIVVAQVTRRF